MKRILLLADDPILQNFFREKFQAAGVLMESAGSAAEAASVLREKQVSLVLADPVAAEGGALETLASLRGILGGTPFHIFSKLPADVLASAEKAGAANIPGDHAPESAASAALIAVGAVAPESPSDEAAAHWQRMVIESAPPAVNAIRGAMHLFIKDTRDRAALHTLFRELHLLGNHAAVAGLDAAEKMTRAVEALVYDLWTMPEQVNDSVLRTVSQSIDFLHSLFDEENSRRAQDPSMSDVFVVDDEASARQMISAAMKMVDLKITCAADPEMALSVLEDNQFNLIFLDVNLPDESGFSLCTKVRQLEDHKKTPVVFLTGLATFQNRAQSSLSGGNDFVGKPFNLHELGVKALTWIFKEQLAMV